MTEGFDEWNWTFVDFWVVKVLRVSSCVTLWRNLSSTSWKLTSEPVIQNAYKVAGAVKCVVGMIMAHIPPSEISN